MTSPDPIDLAGRILEKVAELHAAGKKDAAAALRVEMTRDDPALFALVYLRRHLTDTETQRVTLSEVHLAWAEIARQWASSEPRRDAIIAPRSMGKSTWFFLALPMWAAAHGHARFVAAFANSAGQAQAHLMTFKRELDGNRLLREDYPGLTRPMMRRGRPLADSQDMYIAEGRFAFVARGADTGNLGLKIDDARPDLIVCDDLEPGEGSYSAYQAEQRLTTLLDDILPLNFRANVAIVGTTVMSGSIIDQFRKYHDEQEAAAVRNLDCGSSHVETVAL
ncbi:hypothetical protein [Parabacteroides distasonis]|nr:hypothetical protein [Parabacteroides distasonis]MSA33889.1 hypothetical protein [Parabacteroides distasonis]